MVIDVDITIEKTPSTPGYVFFSEEDWNKILIILGARGVNINYISNHNEEKKNG